ncbi:Rieske (2Fe-2S) protein [Nonomuraea dietziae]|uniref:Cytochrome bc1 complex Rieske iron-sulfur subunit n=1 Tax=Nonomuraea dietziae TaxID=65515 RepID=A0A7W5VCL5_9ACTN|nr:Rieske (2Fe-2S) protein [Nonomuraea dietziae]MBB3733604.1 Rieske Fe-S protein [Nonomuraea dietziae]
MAETTRRAVVLGAGGVSLGALLTACAGYGQPADTVAEQEPTQSDSSAPEPTKSKRAKKPAGEELASTADIPEGGGKVFAQQKVVVTQPSAGEFKCFSAICTHQGCPVDSVEDGTINCPCHGSKYNIADGSVANGPATKALAEKKITVDGEKISLG